MKKSKIFLTIIIFIILIVNACSQKNDPESDFKASPIEGGKSVEIIEYVGSKWDVRIPSRIQGLPVTRIGDRAFFGKKLVNINIPEGITHIGDAAFYKNQLTNITIPNSVTNIGFSAFADCDSLKTINVAVGNNFFTSENGVLYNKDKTLLHTYPIGIIENYFNIPSSVISIGHYSFYNCINLTNVTIPNSVTDIGFRSFSNCINLTNVIIPSSVTSIDSEAFYGSGLTSILIPVNVTSIGSFAFKSCENLTEITFEGVYNFEIIFTFCNGMISNLDTYEATISGISGTFIFIKEAYSWFKQ